MNRLASSPLDLLAVLVALSMGGLETIAEERKEAVPRAHQERTLELVVSPDGSTVISCGSEGTAKVWEAGTRRLIRTRRTEGESINALAISSDGKRIATGGSGKKLQVWSLESGEVTTEFAKPGPSDSIVGSLSFSPHGEFLAYGGYLTGVGVLSISRPGTVVRLGVSCVTVFTVRFDPAKGRLAAGCGDSEDAAWIIDRDPAAKAKDHARGTVFVWDAPYDGSPWTLVGHEGAVLPLAFSQDGRTLVSSQIFGGFRVWDIEKRVERRIVKTTEAIGLAIAISRDGQKIASTEEVDPKDRDKQWDAIAIWDLDGNRTGRTATEHYAISCLEFAPDGQGLYVGSNDGTLELWDWKKGVRIECFLDPEVK